MRTTIEGSPSFSYIHIDLDPGERILAEAGAMASMDADLDVKAIFNGGIVLAFIRRYLGGEALFTNVFTNNTSKPRRLTLVQTTPGDIKELALRDQALCLQPGAFVAATPGLKIKVRWAGLASFFAKEGLFKLLVQGQGKLWIGAYGGILFKDVVGAHLVDSGHLVAYEPQLRLKLQLAGGLFSSLFGREGLVARVEGQGKIAIQTRSLDSLRDFINPFLY